MGEGLRSLLGQAPPVLSLAERDRRWSGLRALMAARGIDAILVGSFMGRESLESYLIDDYLDSIVLLPLEGAPVVLTFSPSRVSRMHESAWRGHDIWVDDFRIGFGGAKIAGLLEEKSLARGRIGIVGFGPTAPGEMEGQLPFGFHKNLVAKLPQADIVDFTRDYTDFILVKSPEEIALLRYAAAVSEKACAAMLAASRPGVSEAEVYADIMREIYRHGCSVRYPYLSLQSGPENISWGAPRWTFRAEAPRILETGDLVQAEIHTLYGGQEGQVQMSVALGPIHKDYEICAGAACEAYEAGVAAIRPGVTFESIVRAMEKPIAKAGCWGKTPLLHTITFGSTGFTTVNREQIGNTQEGVIESQMTPGIRRPDLVLQEGMGLELEPNACLGNRRINIGGGVLVTANGCEELNDISTRVHHVA